MSSKDWSSDDRQVRQPNIIQKTVSRNISVHISSHLFYLVTKGKLLSGLVDSGRKVLIGIALLGTEVPLDYVEGLLVYRHVLHDGKKERRWLRDGAVQKCVIHHRENVKECHRLANGNREIKNPRQSFTAYDSPGS